MAKPTSKWSRPTPEPRFGSRALFPTLSQRVYANHAAISPPSTLVQDGVSRCIDDFARRGGNAFGHWYHQRIALKAALGALFDVPVDALGLIGSTSSGLSAVALCYPWHRGDKILLFKGEFPANVTPWQRAADLFDLTTESIDLNAPIYDCDAALVNAIETRLKHGVRLVAMSAVQFQTGRRMPLAETSRLCREYGATLCIDAIQAAGIVPFDFTLADYVICGGHKWLMGAEGAGFIYATPANAAQLVPRIASWLSHENPIDFLFEGPGLMNERKAIRQTIDFVERGSPNTYGYAALEAGISPLAHLGIAAIYRHVQLWHDRLEPHLLELGFRSLRRTAKASRSGILSCIPPADISAPELATRLSSVGIATAAPDGHLRFAPHWPNSLDEVPIVQRALQEALTHTRQGKPG